MTRIHVRYLAMILMAACYLAATPAAAPAGPSIPVVPTPDRAAAAQALEAVIRADTATFGVGADLMPGQVFYLDLYVFADTSAEAHPVDAVVKIEGPLSVQMVSAVSNGWNGESCTVQTGAAAERRGLTILTCKFAPAQDRPQSVHFTVNIPKCYGLVPGQPFIKATAHIADEAGNFAGATEYMKVSAGRQTCIQYFPAFYAAKQ